MEQIIRVASRNQGPGHFAGGEDNDISGRRRGRFAVCVARLDIWAGERKAATIEDSCLLAILEPNPCTRTLLTVPAK